jgi:hypothetical protein
MSALGPLLRAKPARSCFGQAPKMALVEARLSAIRAHFIAIVASTAGYS